MDQRIARIDASRVGDFFRLHCPENGEGWCNCVAWWVPTWEGWGDRTAEQNRALREQLFARGEYDGYLLYSAPDRPIAWCQVGPRDRLTKLLTQYQLAPDPEVWAITCFVVAPDHRRTGSARRLLCGVLEDLPDRGVRRVQAFPRPAAAEAGEMWTGPLRLYEQCGFRVVREHERLPILQIDLARWAKAVAVVRLAPRPTATPPPSSPSPRQARAVPPSSTSRGR